MANGGGIVDRRIREARDRRRDELAVDMLERYRREALGESIYLDEQARQAAAELAAQPERHPLVDALMAPIRMFSPENIGEWYSGGGGVKDIPTGPVRTKQDAMAYLSRIYPPGSPRYKEIADQIQEINARRRFRESLPAVSKVVNRPVDELERMGIEGVNQYLEAQVAEPKPRIAAERREGPQGEAREVVSFRDPRTGEEIRPATKGGPAYSVHGEIYYDEDGNVIRVVGPKQFHEAFGRERGRGEARRVEEAKKHRQALMSLGRSAAAILRTVGEGEDPQGRMRNILATIHSASAQAVQGVRFMGFESLADWASSNPEGFTTVSKERGKLRQLELETAGALAAVMNPTDIEIKKGHIELALKTIRPIMKAGTKAEIKSGLRQLVKSNVQKYGTAYGDLIQAEMVGGILPETPWLMELGIFEEEDQPRGRKTPSRVMTYEEWQRQGQR